MSVEAMSWVWKHSPYDAGAAFIVHLAIGDVVNDTYHNEFFMTTQDLADKSRCSRSTAVSTLRDLCDRGMLEVVEKGGGRGKPTRYRFLMPADMPLWTNEETARSPDSFSKLRDGSKLRDANGETARSHGRIERTQRTQEHKDDRAVFSADTNCVRCHGDGVILSSSPGPDGEPFHLPCPCVDLEYVPGPSKATRPVVGFGMPANRRKSG